MVDWSEENAAAFTPRNLSNEDYFVKHHMQSLLYEALQLCETSEAYKNYFSLANEVRSKKQIKRKENGNAKRSERTLQFLKSRRILVALDLASNNSLRRQKHGKKLKMDYKFLGDTEFSSGTSECSRDCRDQVPPSPSCMSESSTVFSDDYTQMTELGDGSDLDIRSPPESASGEDCDSTLELSDRSSIGTISSDLDRVTLDFSNEASNKEDDTETSGNDMYKNVASGDVKPDLRVLLTKGFSKMLEDSLLDETSNDSGDGKNKPVGFYEDKEFDFLKIEPVKRSTSLKTSKTPPGTPARKKVVRFADALGLDLEDVRHVLNSQDPPQIPESAMKDLKVGLEEDHKTEGTRYLSACFPQPGASPTFIQRVRDEKVLLENCIISDPDLTVTGTVRVANIAFNKQVFVRYTVNNWMTFTDVQASYVHNSNDGATDRFSFSLNVPSYFAEGSKLQFAVMYRCNGQEFWDSNTGRNYVIECYAKAVPVTEADNTWLHFM